MEGGDPVTEAAEYTVTLRIVAPDDPAGWDWQSLMDDGEYIVAPIVSQKTGRIYRVDDGPVPVLVDFATEPELLLGQWVNVNFHGGLVVGGRLAAADSETITLVASPGGKPEHFARMAIRTVTPGKDPKPTRSTPPGGF